MSTVAKDRLAAVTAVHDVIDGTGIFDSKLASHVAKPGAIGLTLQKEY